MSDKGLMSSLQNLFSEEKNYSLKNLPDYLLVDGSLAFDLPKIKNMNKHVCVLDEDLNDLHDALTSKRVRMVKDIDDSSELKEKDINLSKFLKETFKNHQNFIFKNHVALKSQYVESFRFSWFSCFPTRSYKMILKRSEYFDIDPQDLKKMGAENYHFKRPLWSEKALKSYINRHTRYVGDIMRYFIVCEDFFKEDDGLVGLEDFDPIISITYEVKLGLQWSECTQHIYINVFYVAMEGYSEPSIEFAKYNYKDNRFFYEEDSDGSFDAEEIAKSVIMQAMINKNSYGNSKLA